MDANRQTEIPGMVFQPGSNQDWDGVTTRPEMGSVVEPVQAPRSPVWPWERAINRTTSRTRKDSDWGKRESSSSPNPTLMERGKGQVQLRTRADLARVLKVLINNL